MNSPQSFGGRMKVGPTTLKGLNVRIKIIQTFLGCKVCSYHFFQRFHVQGFKGYSNFVHSG